MKRRRLIYDARTGATSVVEEEAGEPLLPQISEVSIDIGEVKRLLDYAKKQGWI